MTKIITSKLDKYFMLYAVVGWSFMILLGTTFNGGFNLTFKYLSIPIAVVTLAFIHVKSRDLPTKAKARVWLFGCIFYPIIILFTWPYVLTLNAITSNGETVTFSGPVIGKSIDGSRSPAYNITIRNQPNDDKVVISVSRGDFARIMVGDSYKFCYFMGRFGIPYFWRFSGQPQC